MNSIEENEKRAGDEAVAGFEPLAVRFVGVARVIAIVGGGLGFACVAVVFGILEAVFGRVELVIW